MKTIMLSLLAAFALISCEDIQDNSPALQANLNDVLYRSTATWAEIKTDGTLVIEGLTSNEKIILTLNGSSEGVYTLGGNRPNRGVFQDLNSSIYTTRPFGNGQVRITNNTGNTLSGEFSFLAYRFGLDTLFVRKGVFYQVPIVSGSTGGDNGGTVTVFSAKVNGDDFNATAINAANTGNFIVITGDNQNASIGITLPNQIGVGSYNLGQQGVNLVYILNSQPLVSESGQVTITAHDTQQKVIAGTFSFEIGEPDNISITEGQFSISY